jgi:hypothetical protein
VASVPFASPARKQAYPKKRRERAPFATIVAATGLRAQRSIRKATAYQDLRPRASRAHRDLSARGPHPDWASGGMPRHHGWGEEDLAAHPYAAFAAGSMRAHPAARSRPPARAMKAAFATAPNIATVAPQPALAKKACDRRRGYSVRSALLRVRDCRAHPTGTGLAVARKPVRRPVSCVVCFQDSASIAEGCDASARLHAHRVPPRR